MGIFNRQNKAARGNNFSPEGVTKLWTRAPTKEKGELPDLAHKSPRLDPVGIIGRSIASTEILIYDKRDLRVNRENAKPVPEHDAYTLLEYPIKRYPEIDQYALIYLTSALVDLTGEFGWLKLRDERGRVVELNPIPSAWITGTPTASTPYFVVYPFGVSAGRVFNIPSQDMVYFKRSDLTDPYGRGRGTAESIIDEVQTDELFSKASKNFAYNDATPPFLLSVPGMPKDQADALKESWKQKLGGWMHRREPAIVGFDATVTPLGLSPVEMDFVESRKFLRDESLQHYQIPPEIYGVLESSNRSTVDAAYFLYHKNVLFDRYRFIERVITRQLIATDFDVNLCAKFDEKVPEDEAFRLSVLNAGIDKMLVKRSEWRRAWKLPVTEKDDVYIGSFNLYEIPASGKAPEPSKPEGTTEEIPEDKPTDEEAKSIIAVHIIDNEPVVIKEGDEAQLKYSEDQPRDESGRFGSGGGGGSESTDFASYAERNYSDIASNVSEKQLQANLVYANTGYSDMNRVARGETENMSDSDVAKVKGYNKQLNGYIKGNSLPEDAVLSRGFSVPKGVTLKEGAILENKGFSSFTSDKETAINFSGGNKNSVIITVKAAAGSSFAPALRSMGGKVGLNTKESEFIGSTGMKFRVVKEKGTVDHFSGRKIKEYEVEIYE